VRGEREQNQVAQFLLAFEILPVSLDVGRIGGLFRRDYGPSHGTGLADALIGATAQLHRATLVTFNERHYPMLTDVEVPYVRA
jgi:predicted nucleic acid-binding protein